MDEAIDTEPAAHYDRVTDAWQLLLGESLHYGVFDTPEAALVDATRALTDRMVAAAAFEPGQRVLDVGCGTGGPACRLVSEHQVDVVGITTSEIGVERATARAAEAGLSDRATFELRDGTENGLPDASFDRVWALESSHLMADRAGLISECARVLRPGGRLILCDLIRRREIPFAEVRSRRVEFGVLRDAFGDARMDSLESYLDLARNHQLRITESVDLTNLTLPTFDRWRANIAEHRGEIARLLGPEGVDVFTRSCDILEAFWRDGTFGYGLFAASRPG